MQGWFRKLSWKFQPIFLAFKRENWDKSRSEQVHENKNSFQIWWNVGSLSMLMVVSYFQDLLLISPRGFTFDCQLANNKLRLPIFTIRYSICHALTLQLLKATQQIENYKISIENASSSCFEKSILSSQMEFHSLRHRSCFKPMFVQIKGSQIAGPTHGEFMKKDLQHCANWATSHIQSFSSYDSHKSNMIYIFQKICKHRSDI